MVMTWQLALVAVVAFQALQRKPLTILQCLISVLITDYGVDVSVEPTPESTMKSSLLGVE